MRQLSENQQNQLDALARQIANALPAEERCAALIRELTDKITTDGDRSDIEVDIFEKDAEIERLQAINEALTIAYKHLYKSKTDYAYAAVYGSPAHDLLRKHYAESLDVIELLKSTIDKLSGELSNCKSELVAAELVQSELNSKVMNLWLDYQNKDKDEHTWGIL